MKIAIVAPCPVPFIVGGAEKLWWGLARYLNENTDHQADIIKLPAPENNFWSLIDSYQRFSLLRLDGFDLVISGKYPAWMIQHPRHICYMLHRLRGLYDAYSGPALAPLSSYPIAIQELLNLIDSHAGQNDILPEFFTRLTEISDEDAEAKAAFAFPGPLSRLVVHFLDNLALAPSRISRFAAISKTVAQRIDYFPPGVDVAVAYPPSNLTISIGDRYDYLFTASRLDKIKRIHLLIDAMRHHVNAKIDLLIAGVGPEQEQLQLLAEGDSRIKLLGFKNDIELATLYQNALAVPFIPYQEDYGLVTIEAMMAGKPVITVKDAGGPTELVRHNENGLITDATPKALGQALNQLANNPDLARNLGACGRLVADRITWRHVVDNLLVSLPGEQTDPSISRPRKSNKLVVAVTFSIYPPRHGGQNRVYHFYRHLAKVFDIVIITMVGSDIPQTDFEIAPGVREIRIPKSREHAKQEAKLQSAVALPITDIAAALFYRHTPAFLEAIKSEAIDATALVACHPYFFPALAEIVDKPVWYEAQDVEFQLKTNLLPRKGIGQELASKVKELEKACCQASQFIFACSQEDAAILSKEFNINPDKIILVPNGTNCGEISYASAVNRKKLKLRLGCDDQKFVLFMGSGHQPNIVAFHEILHLANRVPEVTFLIAGSVCYALDPNVVTDNVWLLGEVTEISRKIVMELADIALNPMLGGSGTNIKMLDYFAAGIPVISTEIGARGLDVKDGEHLLIRPVGEMASAIQQLLTQPELANRLAEVARLHVEQNFDWQQITNNTLTNISQLTDLTLYP